MARTFKEGKRHGRLIKSHPPRVDAKLWEPIRNRATYGRTEKILRRNRKIWTRLLNKRRRLVDKLAAETSRDDPPS